MFPSSAWLVSKNRPIHPEWDAQVSNLQKPRRTPRQSSLSMGLPMPRVIEESPEKPKNSKPSFNPAVAPFIPVVSRNVSGSSLSQTETSCTNSEHGDTFIDDRGIPSYMSYWQHELDRQTEERTSKPLRYTPGMEFNPTYGHVVAPVAIPCIEFAPSNEVSLYAHPNKNFGVIGGES